MARMQAEVIWHGMAGLLHHACPPYNLNVGMPADPIYEVLFPIYFPSMKCS